MYFKAGEREIRYSSVYGRDSHSRLLVIHERDGIVTGRLFLVMYSNLMGSQFAQESCLDQYWVGRQGICVRRPASEEPDWADVLRRLDALGVAELPSYPAPPFPEDTTPLPPTKPGMLPWTGSRGFFGTGRAIPSNSAILSCTGDTRFRRCLIRPLERPSETRRSCACWSARLRATVAVHVPMTGGRRCGLAYLCPRSSAPSASSQHRSSRNVSGRGSSRTRSQSGQQPNDFG